jgi:hypothetical protein
MYLQRLKRRELPSWCFLLLLLLLLLPAPSLISNLHYYLLLPHFLLLVRRLLLLLLCVSSLSFGCPKAPPFLCAADGGPDATWC